MRDWVNIIGLGLAMPTRVEQSFTEKLAISHAACTMRQQRVIETIFRHAGVQQRGSVLADVGFDQLYQSNSDIDKVSDPGPGTGARLEQYVKYALPLAHRACEEALVQSGVKRNAITHIVVVSCTGLASPGLDIRLIETLGLVPSVGRTMIGFMGCHGAFNGMQVARAIARSDCNARVLLCCVELCTLHFQYGYERSQMVANALFADGSAALVIGQSNVESPLSLIDTASAILPNTQDDMSWTIGDHGFVMTLSSHVPVAIADNLRPMIDQFLKRFNLTLADINAFAIHPGGPRIVAAAGEALGLNEQQIQLSMDVLRDCGNMSSATILFIIERIQKSGVKGNIIAMAFGPGLVAEVALFCCL